MTQLAADFSPVNIEERKKIGIRSGDTVRVHLKIEEKGKTRIQVFEGIVLATKHGTEPGATFTVRRVTGGVGVERIFPLYSPSIDKVEIVKRARVRRSKLYYIREKVAREIRRQMRNARFVEMSTTSETEQAAERERAAKEAEEAAAREAEEKAKQEAEAAAKAEAEASAAEAPAEEVATEDATTEGTTEDAAEETPAGSTEEKEA